MAHIAKCLINVDSHISKQAAQNSQQSDQTPPLPPPPPPPPGAEKSFTWRMQQADPPRKYQLFPKERKPPVLNNNNNIVNKPPPDVEKPLPAIGVEMEKQQQQRHSPSPQQVTANAIMKRLNPQSLVRRRKISVPELGPMTTVQEIAMDSPTIPGRPPLHERSNSAPGRSSRKQYLADTFLYTESDDEFSEILSPVAESHPSRNPPLPPSPKQLTPLVIPKPDFVAPRLRHQKSLNQFSGRSDSFRKARTDGSPRSRTPLTTPSSSLPDLISPKSASTVGTPGAGLVTPVSAPIMGCRTASPSLMDDRYTHPAIPEQPTIVKGHHRGESEPSGIMDRGRPRKRSESRQNIGPFIRRSESKRSKSTDQSTIQAAFEQLPLGIKPSEVTEKLGPNEISMLQKQALAQVERFEVLRPVDVELLSRELRHLDERAEYLRRTYNSLRVGRRNLHSRICQYLRSPRMANYSHVSMLRQEEALAELDASIDDWVNKLEQADNRRTRVRQKLLEHVAAAATLSLERVSNPYTSPVQQVNTPPLSGVCSISTPPGSPSKQTFTRAHSRNKSLPPQMTAATVPDTILEQLLEKEAALVKETTAPTQAEEQPTSDSTPYDHVDMDSIIRVYAGDDVYTLLADVENEFTKMNSNDNDLPSNDTQDSLVLEQKRTALPEQKSNEMLIDTGNSKHASPKLESAASPDVNTERERSATIKQAPVEESILILANKVYKP
ncbi:Up-regulated during septation-domain-containing protein [Mariannaea sp. PMI_226]|nr:Up-regulated during septation-domain-containing protein [Mariannaea sp. PMI_226]